MTAPDFAGNRMWGLKELLPPEPISWYPATSGWLVVFAIVLLVVGWLCRRGLRARQRQRYRREALARVEAMRGAPHTLVELPLVLRAAALAAFPRDEVASLRGSDWVAWLNENGAHLEPGDAEWLDRLPYETNATDLLPADVAARLVDAGCNWVRNHRARL